MSENAFETPTKPKSPPASAPGAPMRRARAVSESLPRVDNKGRLYIPESDEEEENILPSPIPLMRSQADGTVRNFELEFRKAEFKRRFWETFETVMNARIQFSEALSDILLLVVLIYQWPIWICFLFVVAFRLPLIIQRERMRL